MRIRCPICRKELEIAGIGDLPTFPFCSDRCKLVDLGRWIDGAYAVPETKSPSDPDDDEMTDDEEEE